ncbi:NAD-dependent epimerase/dehydratase family protein [Aureliella helgolandensis]|uniref:NAD-dependent epimerase/dehydratase family protein n=1 Tax=Aureliella helgolandensis TaxID=2527968 RepID=UPI001E60029A|nr:NAD-dependent epimerase/dehydratase family protein [Aureliella helgolandensis]
MSNVNNLETIADVTQLEELLSRPTDALVETMQRVSGDILFLGAGGKLGPSLARMARRAADQAGGNRRIIAVSRFSNQQAERGLQEFGVETVRAELLDTEALRQLPDAENVIYMAGYKFGAFGNPSLTWAMNSFLPGMAMQRFADSRVVAFSTSCVYGLSPWQSAGTVETDPLQPTDEYSMSCIGRERIIDHFSRTHGTSASLLRLNYAVEMRYGVLIDIAQAVYNERPINLTMGHFNLIWQTDANAISLQTLDHVSSPPMVINVVGPETLSVRRVAEEFGQLMGKQPRFNGTESDSCLLTSGERCHQLFGYPSVSAGKLIQWTADWIMRGGPTHDKPTGFQVRDGRY